MKFKGNLQEFKICMNQCYSCKNFIETQTVGYSYCEKHDKFLDNCKDYIICPNNHPVSKPNEN